MKKILIVKIGALGDLSFALPAARLLKESLPCHVSWLAGKNYNSFLKGHRYIDNLILVDEKKLYSNNRWVRFVEAIKLIFRIKKRFDHVIIAHRDKNYYRFFKLFSRGLVFQLVRKASHLPNLVHVPALTLHESLAIKKLTTLAIKQISLQQNRALRIPGNDLEFDSWEWDYSHIPLSDIKLPNQYIVLHTGGGNNAKTEFKLKCWPYWSELIHQLILKYKVILIGSESEKLEKEIPENNVINLIGKLNLQELVDVIRRCEIFVGVDSGPLHIADSLNKKVIGLFGPTSPISWGLLSPQAQMLHKTVPCSPCYKDDGIFPECHFQHRCMKSITVNEVLETIIGFKVQKH